MAEKVKDPVCGMQVDKSNAAATYEYKGKTYYFCDPSCQCTFEEDPERYLGKSRQSLSGQLSAPSSPRNPRFLLMRNMESAHNLTFR